MIAPRYTSYQARSWREGSWPHKPHGLKRTGRRAVGRLGRLIPRRPAVYYAANSRTPAAFAAFFSSLSKVAKGKPSRKANSR